MAEVEDDFGDEEEDEEEEELVRPKSIYDDEAIVKYQMAVAAAARPSARDEFTTAEAARTIMANRAYDDLTTSASSFYVDTHVRREDQVKPEKPEREWWEVWAARSPLYRHDYQPDPSEFANCGGIVPVVQNVDIMVSLGCSIDLTQVARKLPNCEYDPRKRSGVILRLRNPKATGTLFKSGNLRCMGARSEFLALCAARKFARKVTRLGMYKIHFRKFRVTNIMATADVGFPLTSLGDFAAEFDGDGALYDTEIFCGVRYQLTDPKVGFSPCLSSAAFPSSLAARLTSLNLIHRPSVQFLDFLLHLLAAYHTSEFSCYIRIFFRYNFHVLSVLWCLSDR
jgi:TATA-box binding protein (TBP) (component of TFIID and TFIIIB)